MEGGKEQIVSGDSHLETQANEITARQGSEQLHSRYIETQANEITAYQYARKYIHDI